MKPEPLKGEIYKLSQLRKMTELDGDKELIFVEQVKKRVEELKEEFKINHIHEWNDREEVLRKEINAWKKSYEELKKKFEMKK